MPFLYTYVFYPLAFALLKLLRPFLNAKTQEMMADKTAMIFTLKNLPEDEIRKRRPFWIHAASGEIEYARPVIRELQKNFPGVPILITHSSPSAKKILRSLDGVAAWGPLPWDFPGTSRHFLQRWQPRCLLVARTDVWPMIAASAKKQNVPALLFSATFAENSSRLRGLSAKTTTWALNSLSAIQCVSAEDVKELSRLPLKTPISIRGDTRFDQVFHRLQNPKPLKEALKPASDHSVLIAGSTWPEDERVLLPAFAKLVAVRTDGPRLILAPHEVGEEHLREIEKCLGDNGLTGVRYSNARAWSSHTGREVLIIDQVGLLAELYTWGDIAFVGGSFKRQVHSVMEPLAAGLPVLIGPHHFNNREALVFQKISFDDQAAVSVVRSEEELAKKLTELLDGVSDSFASMLIEELQGRSLATRAVVDWVREVTG
jgi:3-deoxy-D-manno-octulosonic-acid transferase